MSEPTKAVREGTYARDNYQCVSCGRRDLLSYQHRAAVGMGGSKIKPTFEMGVTACAFCNEKYESSLQRPALRFGWKIRKFIEHQGLIPVFYVPEQQWFRLTRLGTREPIPGVEALQMMVNEYGDLYDQWAKGRIV